MMKFALFLGCNIPARLTQYEASARAVLGKLGVGLVDIKAFNCCGYPVRNFDFNAFVLSSARNLALAKKEGFLGKVNFEKLVVNLPNKLYYVPQGMRAKDLQAFEKRAYKEFYRQPRFVLRQLKEIESLPELWRKTKAFLTIQSI